MANLSTLPSHARIWVYAADRNLSVSEAAEIQQAIRLFTSSWTAHDIPLEAGGEILFNQLVLFAVNEQTHPISGCGIDKSVKIIKDLGEKLNLNFFNRMQVLVLKGDTLETHTKASLQAAISNGSLDQDTLVFNPLVQTKGEFEEKGFVPLSTFWMASQLNFAV
jgi:hypothetical protein